MSRLSAPHELVDVARQIAEADAMIGTVVNAKLEVIAEQIQSLQEQARRILERAREDTALHRAVCRFRKRPGQTYHLYQHADGRSYLSMLAPNEWGEPPHRYLGSWRLQADMSWIQAS